MPEIFRDPADLTLLNHGGILLLWKEAQVHLADYPLDKKETLCGIALTPETEAHTVVLVSEADQHLTCASCLYFWNHGVKYEIIEKLKRRGIL